MYTPNTNLLFFKDWFKVHQKFDQKMHKEIVDLQEIILGGTRIQKIENRELDIDELFD